MDERPPEPKKQESEPEVSGVDLFEVLVNKGEWDMPTRVALERLLELYREDLYMVYLNYRESGIAEELSEHERAMYEILQAEFEDEE